MARDTLTGSRIRERRVMKGLKQSDLARRAGISPSYLNLIEHNRRRIGGKLLLDIADILEVAPNVLAEGAEAALIATLREAASGHRGSGAELDRVDEFAGRFPGWAALLAQSRHRIDTLERTVATLTDRMTHDPHLAASLHEMLSTVTAIRSAASILAEPGEIEPEWQARFHRNIHEDSARLAETSRALVTYLEAADDAGADVTVPQEEVDAVLAENGYYIAATDAPGADPDTIAQGIGAGLTPTAQALLRRWLARTVEDARAMPLDAVAAALAATGPDPLALAEALSVPPAAAMRRMVALPEGVLAHPAALAICDASGVLTFRRPLPDFPMPRFGAGCPLWPLYQALNRPMMPIVAPLRMPDATATGFRAYAMAEPVGAFRANRSPLFEAHMLIVPAEPADSEPVLPVGVACRICPRRDCDGRREPSILAETGQEAF
ncbi:short-chain fatty acyl-CoA regulator family protein [Aestuariicoccus sp. MJ-SS9]|uniref:short-chain fatty acyl-CoA regulator family protein n=1 Tax=Aestuariicoccus sp. MJ-SS9 TaxID=3079855 RepID=UPI00290E7898|nr:short-chain fatty acyl-CoA regulator family protein [Aestuariicoccus sp. MJ-SS9]MDU8913734.1 short-chain fatty acyl-CoA regulator family protein [Aestuariicoccus sp. MJ-SS9]